MLSLTGVLAGLAVIAAVAVVFLIAVFIAHARRRIKAHGVIMLAWRYLSGQHHTGMPQVSASGKPLNQVGRVRPFWLKSPRTRARIRCTRIASIVGLLYGYAELRMIGYILTASLLLWGKYRAYRTIRKRRAEAGHHRTLTRPVHYAVAELCGQPLSLPPAHWITVERDRSGVELRLREGTTFTDRQLDRVVNAVGSAIGLSSPQVDQDRTMLAGPEPRLAIAAHPSPPSEVLLAEVRGWMKAKLKADELFLGLGARSAPITLSLSSDSPHLGLSMRSGKGKSRLARLIIAQALAKGWLVVVIDSKRFSQQWCKNLPGVIYARTPAEIREAMVRLGQELDWRNEQAEQYADIEGEVGDMWPRVLVVCEEMNMARQKIVAYWKEHGTGGTDPADTAMADLAFAGRQVLMNLLLISQRMSAKVAGNGDVRENIGARLLNCTAATWKMLASEHVMPPMPKAPGRFWLVVDDSLREVQAVNISAAEAQELAASGASAQPWHDTGDTAGSPLALSGESAGQPCGTVSDGPVPVSPSGAVALSVASADKGLALVPMTLVALRAARARRKWNGFPAPVSRSRGAEEYDPDELAAWYEQRHAKEKATA